MSSQAAVFDIERLSGFDLQHLTKAEFESILSQGFAAWQLDRKEMALLHYEPASEQAAKVHVSSARVKCVFGGNGSSKSEGALVDGIIRLTGIVPESLKRRFPQHDWKKTHLRGPIQGRVICESIVNVLTPIIMPKLRWNHWTGVDEPGGERGHWGWIPKFCLIDGEWQKSWREKDRLLRLYYRNPDNPDEILGESQLQFMSKDQHYSDFASGDLHWVLCDEPPSLPIWRENEARTMRVAGVMHLAMTWPDDPSINVDWIHDELYERGTPGPKKHPDFECFELHTTQNKHLNQESIRQQMEAWDEKTRRVRIFGGQIRFSNRVHPDFTDVPRNWCFFCGEDQIVSDGRCIVCANTDVEEYCHVEDFDWNASWPVLHVIDPHPRKPHMTAFIGITPWDDWWQVAELECTGDPSDLRAASEDLEAALNLRVVRRLIDPRMAGNPSGVNRDRTWGDEFDSAGLYCDPAISSDVGRKIVDQMLKPDARTRKPRIILHTRCVNSIYQMKRFMWEDWRIGTDKGQKQKAKEKYDDYPACWRYFANDEPQFGAFAEGSRGSVQGNYRRYPTRAAR